MDGGPTNLVELENLRARAIEVLAEHYSTDVLSMDEYERRVDLAQRATSIAGLEPLVVDLEPLQPTGRPTTALAQRTEMTIVPADQLPRRQSAVSVLSSVSRRGPWAVPRRLKAVAILGEVTLDFREAKISEDTTILDVTCVLGEVKVIVPPQMRVDLEGMGVLGEFEHGEQGESKPDPRAPRLLIRGLAALGEVSVNTRLAGESWWEAWKRRRRQRKKRKRLAAAKRNQLGPGS